MDSIPTKGKFSTTRAPWRSITKGLSWFENNPDWEINDGEQISFWHSKWSQEDPFYIRYPRTLCTLTI